MSLKFEQIHAVISGNVQGVGFRYATRKKAISLGVSGWVRNRETGEVEVEGIGSSAGIEALYQWLLQGPPSARVSQVQVLSRGPSALAPSPDFEIRRDG